MSSAVSRTFQAHIHLIEQTPSGVLLVWLKPDDNFDHIHRAGQYLSLVINGVPSFFSIASMPITNSLIELHIQIFDEAKTEFLLQSFSRKVPVTISYPFGSVIWPVDLPVGIFICRGTGFAPVKALIESALSRNPDRPVYLYWEGDSQKDFYFDQWLAHGLKKYSHLHAHLFFAQEKNSDVSRFKAQGSQCRYEPVNLMDFLMQGHLKQGFQNSWYYFCASPNRVYQWVDILQAQGIPLSAMASDVFEYAPRNQPFA